MPEIIDNKQKIEKALESLQLTEEVTFPKAWLPTLFDSLRDKISAERIQELLPVLGEDVGIWLGNLFMDSLYRQEQVPSTESIVLELLCQYHTRNRWGDFTYQRNQDNLEIIVENSLFLQYHGSKDHRYCSFLGGYLLGWLWVALRDWHRWFRNIILATPIESSLKPTKVTENQRDLRCKFSAPLSAEDLVEAFDNLFAGKERFRAGSYLEALIHIRTSLEAGFKVKAGIPTSSRVAFFALLDAYKKAVIPNDPLDYKSAGKIYEAASTAIHVLSKPESAREIAEKIINTERLLKKLEWMTIGRKYRQRICVEVGVTYSSSLESN